MPTKKKNRENLFIEIAKFIWNKKAYWLLPTIILLGILIAFIVVGTSPAAPFIYSVM